MRHATTISVAAHGLALAALVLVVQPVPPPRPNTPKAAVAVAVALAPLPPRPAPATAAPLPQPRRPTPPRPTAQRVATPQPAAVMPAPAMPVAAPAAPAEEAPPVPAPQRTPVPGGGDASWLAQVRARLEGAKRYPPAAARRGDQGVAVIVLEIAPDGTILAHALKDSSGSPLLDREAESLPERVRALPPMPESMAGRPLTLVVPINFSLRQER
jgi:protein TonB